jgi:hypothetical protein
MLYILLARVRHFRSTLWTPTLRLPQLHTLAAVSSEMNAMARLTLEDGLEESDSGQFHVYHSFNTKGSRYMGTDIHHSDSMCILAVFCRPNLVSMDLQTTPIRPFPNKSSSLPKNVEIHASLPELIHTNK